MTDKDICRRIWECKCGTILISTPLDIETYARIPNFSHCPICLKGTLEKHEV